MSDQEQAPSILDEIEKAKDPQQLAGVLGELSLRRVIGASLNFGRNLWKVTTNGDAREMLSHAIGRYL
jgi:hypothetical protein